MAAGIPNSTITSVVATADGRYFKVEMSYDYKGAFSRLHYTTLPKDQWPVANTTPTGDPGPAKEGGTPPKQGGTPPDEPEKEPTPPTDPGDEGGGDEGQPGPDDNPEDDGTTSQIPGGGPGGDFPGGNNPSNRRGTTGGRMPWGGGNGGSSGPYGGGGGGRGPGSGMLPPWQQPGFVPRPYSPGGGGGGNNGGGGGVPPSNPYPTPPPYTPPGGTPGQPGGQPSLNKSIYTPGWASKGYSFSGGGPGQSFEYSANPTNAMANVANQAMLPYSMPNYFGTDPGALAGTGTPYSSLGTGTPAAAPAYEQRRGIA